jgi:hypothetical protein
MIAMTWTYIENPAGTLARLVTKLAHSTCTPCIIVMGPVGSGKSTLVETALAACGDACVVRRWSVDQHVDCLRPAHGSVAAYFARDLHVSSPESETKTKMTIILVEDVDVAIATSRGLHLLLAQQIKTLRGARSKTKYMLTASSTSDVKAFKSFINALAMPPEDVLNIVHPSHQDIDQHLATWSARHNVVIDASFTRDHKYDLKSIRCSLIAAKRTMSLAAERLDSRRDSSFNSQKGSFDECTHAIPKNRKDANLLLLGAQCCVALLNDAGCDGMADDMNNVVDAALRKMY